MVPLGAYAHESAIALEQSKKFVVNTRIESKFGLECIANKFILREFASSIVLNDLSEDLNVVKGVEFGVLFGFGRRRIHRFASKVGNADRRGAARSFGQAEIARCCSQVEEAAAGASAHVKGLGDLARRPGVAAVVDPDR